MKDYPVCRISQYTNIYDQSESSTRVKDITKYYEFIKTWKKTFADPQIRKTVKKKIISNTFFLCYHLIINEHRQELSVLKLFGIYLKLFKFNPRKALPIVVKNFYYKLLKK